MMCMIVWMCTGILIYDLLDLTGRLYSRVYDGFDIYLCGYLDVFDLWAEICDLVGLVV